MVPHFLSVFPLASHADERVYRVVSLFLEGGEWAGGGTKNDYKLERPFWSSNLSISNFKNLPQPASLSYCFMYHSCILYSTPLLRQFSLLESPLAFSRVFSPAVHLFGDFKTQPSNHGMSLGPFGLLHIFFSALKSSVVYGAQSFLQGKVLSQICPVGNRF